MKIAKSNTLKLLVVIGLVTANAFAVAPPPSRGRNAKNPSGTVGTPILKSKVAVFGP